MMTAQKNEKRVRDFAGETTDTIREYLTAIGQHPLLEKADEIRLGLAVDEPDGTPSAAGRLRPRVRLSAIDN